MDKIPTLYRKILKTKKVHKFTMENTKNIPINMLLMDHTYA